MIRTRVQNTDEKCGYQKMLSNEDWNEAITQDDTKHIEPFTGTICNLMRRGSS